MNPDNQTILLWLEDELPAPQTLELDAWAAQHRPELLSTRQNMRDSLPSWSSALRNALPSDHALPHADFFQSKLMSAITPVKPHTASDKNIIAFPWWKKYVLPVATAAAVIIAFFIGKNTATSSAETLVLYTPEQGVKAEYFTTSPADATVIVLNGINPIPDELSLPTSTDKPSTAHDAATSAAP